MKTYKLVGRKHVSRARGKIPAALKIRVLQLVMKQSYKCPDAMQQASLEFGIPLKPSYYKQAATHVRRFKIEVQKWLAKGVPEVVELVKAARLDKDDRHSDEDHEKAYELIKHSNLWKEL